MAARNKICSSPFVELFLLALYAFSYLHSGCDSLVRVLIDFVKVCVVLKVLICILTIFMLVLSPSVRLKMRQQWIRFPISAMKYLIFTFSISGNKETLGIEFHHAMPLDFCERWVTEIS